MSLFNLVSEYSPRGDQVDAIAGLVKNLEQGVSSQVLLGVTGSGKTFTMANVIATLNRPALIMAPNKTLAAQLYNEFRLLFPENAVEYFVSYYDYYQPEAYLPRTDTYIEKDSSINDDIDKLRHSATHALLTRRDVIIIASVSCIYGLGSPDYYAKMIIPIEEGQSFDMDELMGRLVEIQYERNDYDFHRGTFRVRGDVLELIPAYRMEQALRIEFFGDTVEAIYEADPLTGEIKSRLKKTIIYPGSHYVSDQDNLQRAMNDIREELRHRLAWFEKNNMLVEAQRLEQKTQLDLEMIQEMGYCNGIENYSRHLDGRKQGQPPSCLLDYFPEDYLLFMDESHISVSQVGGMYHGDMSRKKTLVDYGFRLPSALDNRPLSFDEFLERMGQTTFVSATPGDWEIEHAHGLLVEQIIRPTGLVDPEVEIRPTDGQMDDLLNECLKVQKNNERVLVTTLTKRMAEDLTDYIQERGVKTRYLHSDIDTLERVAIIQALRGGEFSVLVGINLLREGLDIPEVSLVAILDADKEGFLRSFRSMIQTFGRASRNVSGRVIMYADKVTGSMQRAMEETDRRREKQIQFNKEHDIVPATIIKKGINTLYDMHQHDKPENIGFAAEEILAYGTDKDKLEKEIKKLEREMRALARDLEFEKAALVRDKLHALKKVLMV
ncbi:MAG: excinuclease ABC subunit UvrB [Desulfonatronovibrio sp.]